MKRIVDPLFELVNDEDREAITSVVNGILKEVCTAKEHQSDDDYESEIMDDSFYSIDEPNSAVINDFSEIPSPPPQHPMPIDCFYWNSHVELVREIKEYFVVQRQFTELKMEKTRLELAILKKKCSDD